MKQTRLFIFSLLLLLAFVPAADAQNEPAANKTRINLGLKLGVNMSRIDGQSWDAGYKTNMLGGAFLAVNGGRFGIQAEGLFSQTTYITGDNFNDIYHDYLQAGKDSVQNGRFRLSYFNIPLLAQMRILNRAWLQVGPQFSGNVSVKDLDNFVKDAESLFASGTISLVVGMQIDLTRHLNLGGRYIIGFENVDETGLEQWKQRDIQIHLGYRF